MYGSPAYLTKENINPLKGIVNGTPCTLHSLSWTDANVNAQMQQLISMAPDDEIVMLPIPPDYVNVQINGQTTWDPNDSLLGSEAYVIPVPIAKKRLIVKVRGQNILAKLPALELGFAITYYKLQGKTLPLLILNVYKRGCAPEINLMGLLVGLSRVHESRNVRLLPPPANAGLTPFSEI